MAIGALIFVPNTSPPSFNVSFTFHKNYKAHNCEGRCHDHQGQLCSRWSSELTFTKADKRLTIMTMLLMTVRVLLTTMRVD